jgi:hypothetical protein
MDHEDIRKELVWLFQVQAEALDLAIFVGMTPVGWSEYNERQARIHALREQLRRALKKSA